MLLNAHRRFVQGRYDDNAAARSYRALESLSQFYLATRFNITAGQPDYNRLTEAQCNAVIAQLSSLPDKIALEEGWLMLLALDHSAAQEVFQIQGKKIHNKFRGVLDDRNNSILAHGWKPVGKHRAENMLTRLKELLIKVEGESVNALMARLAPVSLPAFWSAETYASKP